MESIVLAFLTAHPSLAVLVSAAMVLRAVFQPAMAVLEKGVAASGNAEAMKVLNDVEASKAYKVAVEVVAYLSGIDLSTVLASMKK